MKTSAHTKFRRRYTVESELLTGRVNAHTKERVQLLADQTGRSVSSIVREAIKSYVRNSEPGISPRTRNMFEGVA